ncbi:MAG: hypothetical protein ACKO5J_11375 [Rubrivivax sp.]
MKRPSPLLLGLVGLLAAACIGSAHAQGVREEIGKPLQQAGELLRAGKGREALAKAREADAVANKTPAEQLTIDRMKGAAAQRAGDHPTTIQAFEAVMASGKVAGAEGAQIAESLAFAYSQQKDWPKTTQWITRAQSLGSTSPQLKQLQSYVQSQSGDFAAIGRDAAAAIETAERAGRKPEEADLLRLADAQLRAGNASAQAATLEKLLINYPKREYWTATLGRLPRKANFADRLGLDVLRLRLATGNISKAEDFMEMAQLSLQAGLPAEAVRIVEQGFKAGALGKGAEADRHKRLQDLAVKKAAEQRAAIDGQATEAAAQKTGEDLVKVGYAYVSMGQADKGITLIEQGIAKGGLRNAEDAKLRLGLAQLGRDRAKGVRTLQSVKGSDGTADVARLWTLIGS